MLLLRVGRNPAAWEQADAREICRLEFSRKDGLDREPSVYAVPVLAGRDARRTVLQVHAEHTASFLDRPPLQVVDVDIEGLFEGDIRPSLGETQFRLTRESHRYLEVRDEEDLVRLVDRIRAEFTARSYVVTRDEVRLFASERYRANDAEWVEARRSGKFGKWKLVDSPYPTGGPPTVQ